MKTRHCAYLLISILGAATFLRFYNLEHASFVDPDEFRSLGNVSVHAPLFILVHRLLLDFVGERQDVILFAQAFWGTLSVFVTFLLGKHIAGPALGLTSALLLACSPLHVYFSRSGYPVVFETLLAELGLLLLVQQVQIKEGSRTFLWGGAAFFAAAFLSYIPVYALSLAAALALLVCAGKMAQGALRATYFLCGIVLCVGLAIGTLTYVITGRVNFGSYLKALLGHGQKTALFLGEHASSTLSSFVSEGILLAGLPEIALLSAGLVLGICKAKAYGTKPFFFLLICCVVGVCLYIGFALLGFHTLYARHMLVFWPIIAVLVARALHDERAGWYFVLPVCCVLVWNFKTVLERDQKQFKVSALEEALGARNLLQGALLTNLRFESGSFHVLPIPGVYHDFPHGQFRIAWDEVRQAYRRGARYLLIPGLGGECSMGNNDSRLAQAQALLQWPHPYRVQGRAIEGLKDFAVYDLNDLHLENN